MLSIWREDLFVRREWKFDLHFDIGQSDNHDEFLKFRWFQFLNTDQYHEHGELHSHQQLAHYSSLCAPH